MTLLKFTSLICCWALLQSSDTSTKPLIAQSDVVDFAKLGKVKIEVWEATDEPFGRPPTESPKLIFSQAESGQHLETIALTDLGAARVNVRIRFQIMHVQGLPDPLILAVANTNGASDCYYYPIPIARVNGRFRRLLRQTPEMDTQGGFSLGPLGKRGGVGLAVWTFEWGPGESHYDRHRYRIKFYQWNRTDGMLEPLGSELTRKFADGASAGVLAGIDPDMIIDAATLQSWFPEYSC